MAANWRHNPTSINKNLPSPASDIQLEDVFNFPFLMDDETVNYLQNHGRVMFILRGPSGTRKHILSSMITSKYPNGEVCCADDYFSEPFTVGSKTRESFKEAHKYCENSVLKSCQEGKHPIIIKNTHVRKWEMQYYINLAIEYCYTVVMVITLRKMGATPKVLEKTNTQGLTEKYFQNRLRQWEEIIPQFTGWMLNPADLGCLVSEAEKSTMILSELQDFSEIYCKEGDMKSMFSPEYHPFCPATYCNRGADPLMKRYYLSEEVQSSYGKVFNIAVKAFIVTKAMTCAVVHLEEDMKNLVLESKRCVPVSEDTLRFAFRSLHVSGHSKPNLPVSDFLTTSVKTVEFKSKREEENIDTKNCSFIVLFTSKTHDVEYPLIKNVSKVSQEFFSDVANSDGIIPFSSFEKLSEHAKYCKLPNDGWLILTPKILHMKSIFTGLYV